MEITLITIELLKLYFTQNKRHKAYDLTVKIYNRLFLHSSGQYPKELIEDARPSESDKIKEYRKKIFQPITEGTMSKIFTCLMKIRKSPDWSIKFDATKIPARILKNETLEAYTGTSFPIFNSFTNWVFNVYLKNYLIDPNAVVMIMPINRDAKSGEYLRPFPFIFNSDRVIEYIPEDYSVLHSTDKVTYFVNTQAYHDGEVYYVVNRDFIQRWEQYTLDKKFRMAYEYKHNLGYMPAFKTGGVIDEMMDRTVVYKSRINAAHAHLNEAVREYSDLQAEVVQHIHSEKWVYLSQECKACKGQGFNIRLQKNITCDKCQGSGYSTSPYSHLVVTPPSMGQQGNIPTPPAGYIQKDVEIVKIQDERVEKHKFKALASINLEFLHQSESLVAQSGEAKKTDKDELNTFVNSIAEDVVATMDRAYSIMSDYRYKIVVPNEAERKSMLPSVSVPDRFDMLSSDYLLAELTNARNAKVNVVIQNALEIEYANKKFSNDPQVRDELKAVIMLDPFPGMTMDDKLTAYQNDAISEIDYIISCNVYPFIKRAILEDPEFLKKEQKDQVKKLATYAQTMIDDNSAAGKITDPDPGAPPPALPPVPPVPPTPEPAL